MFVVQDYLKKKFGFAYEIKNYYVLILHEIFERSLGASWRLARNLSCEQS